MIVIDWKHIFYNTNINAYVPICHTQIIQLQIFELKYNHFIIFITVINLYVLHPDS